MSDSPQNSQGESQPGVSFGQQENAEDIMTMMEEREPDESLHIGTDLLAERLDYEAEELDEAEEQQCSENNIFNSGQVDSCVAQGATGEYKVDDNQQSSEHGISSDCANISDASLEKTSTNGVTFVEEKARVVDNGETAQAMFDSDNEAVGNVDTFVGQTAALYDANVLVGDENSGEQNGSNEHALATNDQSKGAMSGDGETALDEELEEGEVSDEDEEARKERLKPQPICRFYSKGACTWGSSCRFIHPGVMDTGRYGVSVNHNTSNPNIVPQVICHCNNYHSL